MIGATKRLLIETLLELALGEDIEIEGASFSDHLRAIFLLISSHSILHIPDAERISYETYEDDRTGIPKLISGIAVRESGMLLSDVVQHLRYMTKIPEEIAAEAPELTYEDFQAALYAIQCIIASLQWNESMESYEKRHSPEVARKQILSSLRSLQSYRETGEP